MNFTGHSIDKQLIKLGLPIILGQIGYIFVAFADNMMVGHYGTEELAAASFVNNLLGITFIFGLGFSYGLTPMVAKAYVLGHKKKAGRLLKDSIGVNSLVGVMLVAVMMSMYMSLELFGAPEELLPLIKPYFVLQTISLFIAIVFGAFKQFFDGVGNTALSMWVLLSSNVLNIAGNWLLIYGPGCFPEWGLFGAGVSSLFARVFTLVVLWAVFLKSKKRKEERIGYFSRRKKHYRMALIRLGLPIGIQLGVEAASFSIAVVYVGWLGSKALAAHQIISVVTTLGFMVYYGFGAATTIMVSNFKAENNFMAIRAVIRSGLKLSAYVAALVVLIIIFSRHYIGYLFTNDTEVCAMVALALLPVLVYQFGDVMQIIYANALRGLEDVRFLAKAAVLVHVVIAPTVSYAFGFLLGLEDTGARLAAIWSAFPISLTILGFMLRSRFRKLYRPDL